MALYSLSRYIICVQFDNVGYVTIIIIIDHAEFCTFQSYPL